MNTPLVICAGLAACALVLAGWVLGRRAHTRARPASGSALLNAILERESPRSRRAPSDRGSRVSRSPGEGALLEGHLRTAVFDAGARERLIADAMRSTGGDRAAAIRKVLRDLETEDRRWS